MIRSWIVTFQTFHKLNKTKTSNMRLSTILYRTVFLALPGSLAARNNSYDAWSTANETGIYQTLPNCAKSCVSEVNHKIHNGNLECVSWGCVCSESTLGENFQYGLSNVTSCASSSCGDQADVDSAVTAFEDLCIVYATNGTQQAKPNPPDGKIFRITYTDKQNLTACAKFVLNACLDADGNRTETNCGPMNHLPNWALYKGVADARHCKTSDCLCNTTTGNFDATFDLTYNSSVDYCGMHMSTSVDPDAAYADMMGALATFCAGQKYPPHVWAIPVVGVDPNSTSTHHKGKYSLDQQVQLGLGIGLGLPANLLAAAGLWFSRGMLKSARLAIPGATPSS
ncbi:hypothetical protein BU16DRAFT_3884 [Lophium mytilinum]|uniref:CFEM domain-containing protein n=1 Tax=Lophium mytilinum TaxID=390894 RepID=A0A6A6RBW1_9PEZI|nr:hypothetical protein BU16DRAFT_3884 [Lophium mytilinum]